MSSEPRAKTKTISAKADRTGARAIVAFEKRFEVGSHISEDEFLWKRLQTN